MSFYSLISNDIIDKSEIEKIVKQAKLDRLQALSQKLDSIAEIVEDKLISASMPENTLEIVKEKRTKKINKLKIKCQEKRIKKMLG